LTYLRKNRKFDSSMKACSNSDEYGVDLNRNYGFKFGADEIGSSSSPCDERYRGTKAFSEPETRAMRDFLRSLPNMKIALNFHAWGNYFIYPFCFDATANSLLESDF